METPQNNGAQNEQDLGVSRSGRIRKKSSKLLDFQSPEEEKKVNKRLTKTIRTGIRGRPSAAARKQFNESEHSDDVADDDEDLDECAEDDEAEAEELGLAEKMEYENKTADKAQSQRLADSEDELDELVADLVEGVEAENANNGESKVRQSLYMTEKSNKRKMLRDGIVITGKLERKDKGKSRYTAYSLWAREFRKTSKFSKNQDLDFSNAARRLGELWANVSNKEKNAWRRKAKIQATKSKAREKYTTNVGNSMAPIANRATTIRTRKLAAERQRTPPKTVRRPERNLKSNQKMPIMNAPLKSKRHNSHRSPIKNLRTQTANVVAESTSLPVRSPHLSAASNNSKLQLALPKIEAIDSAAHLKLLGESLAIIGERLKEHDGQIAVSGSLSVLLDSLLCSLGPLLCLAKNIPGLKEPQLGVNLSTTLDNIAYVMPGL